MCYNFVKVKPSYCVSHLSCATISIEKRKGRVMNMGIVEILILGVVFVALGGCLVYSLVTGKQ